MSLKHYSKAAGFLATYLAGLRNLQQRCMTFVLLSQRPTKKCCLSPAHRSSLDHLIYTAASPRFIPDNGAFRISPTTHPGPRRRPRPALRMQGGGQHSCRIHRLASGNPSPHIEAAHLPRCALPEAYQQLLLLPRGHWCPAEGGMADGTPDVTSRVPQR